MGMANDGNLVYDHEHDGSSQQMGGCLRDFRNKPFPIRAKIEYFKNVLTVRTQPLEFDYMSIDPSAVEYSLGEALTEHGLSTILIDFASHKIPIINDDIDDDILIDIDSFRRHLLSIDVSTSKKETSSDGSRRTGKSRLRKRNQKTSKSSSKNLKLRKRKTRRGAHVKDNMGVLIHNGMTDNERDYEMCYRAENVFLPPKGYFGVTAATGGLADDHDVLRLLVHSLRSADEMAQLRLNQEEEEKFQKEFEQYQQKTQKARDEYMTLLNN
ncbi:Protein ERGIC-53 [Armadillidium vulgare]|nr:Protein ERGIC-53 [Armadillidium vulgare]